MLETMKRLLEFELTRDNWREYIGAFNTLVKFSGARGANRAVVSVGNKLANPKSNEVLEFEEKERVEARAQKLRRRKLARVSGTSDKGWCCGGDSDEENAEDYDGRPKVEHSFVEKRAPQLHLWDTPVKALYAAEIFRPGFRHSPPPMEVITAWKQSLGATLRSPQYFQLVQELNRELGLIKAVKDAKSFYVRSWQGIILSASIGFANFMARYLYDISGLEAAADKAKAAAIDAGSGIDPSLNRAAGVGE